MDNENFMYHARYEKPPKNHSLLMAKKVETYSSSNVVVLNLEEKASYISYTALS